jgi:hypothetical protein
MMLGLVQNLRTKHGAGLHKLHRNSSSQFKLGGNRKPYYFNGPGYAERRL